MDRTVRNLPKAIDDLLSTGVIGRLIGVAPRTVSKWFDSGMLRGYRIPSIGHNRGGGERRVHRSELIRFLKANNMPLGLLEEADWHKVLLIGCDPGVTVRLPALLLEADGFHFLEAASAFEAGLAMHTFAPDTIIIDLAGGRSEGLAMSRRLAEMDPPQPRRVALACEDETGSGQLTEAGFEDVFRRPFDVQLLADSIRWRKDGV